MNPDPIRLDIAGTVTVVLDGAPRAVVEQVRRELGATPFRSAAVTRAALTPSRVTAVAPDGDSPAAGSILEVEFVERLTPHGGLRRLGLSGGAFAYDDQRFYLLDAQGRMAWLDLDAQAGIRVVAEAGVERIPHLADLAGLLFIDRGLVMLHAASAVVGGCGVLIPGWQSAGKSELLLGFLAAGGAAYAGDEWTVVGWPDRTMRGIASDPHVWAWQLDQLPAVARRLGARDAGRLALLRALRAGLRVARPVASAAGGVPARSARTLDGWLANAQRTSGPASRLFGTGVVRRGPIRIDHVLFPEVGDGDTIEAAPIDPADVAARMAASQRYERRGLDGVHAQFRYAFPDRRWARVEAAPEREAATLARSLAGVPAHGIVHPYPPDLARLAAAAATLLD